MFFLGDCGTGGWLVGWLGFDFCFSISLFPAYSEANYNRYRTLTLASVLLGFCCFLIKLFFLKFFFISELVQVFSEVFFHFFTVYCLCFVSCFSDFLISGDLRALQHEAYAYDPKMDSRGFLRSSGQHSHAVLKSRVRMLSLGCSFVLAGGGRFVGLGG